MPAPLLQKLLAQEKRQLLWKDVFHTHLLWAGRCLVAKPRIKQTLLREEVITGLFTLLSKTRYSLTREQVASALVEISGNEVKARLLALLKDKEAPDVQVAVASALGQLGERGVVTDLLALLKDKQEHPEVRGDVAEALGQLGEHAVVPDLLALLKDKQEDRGVRGDVAWSLGELGEQKAIPYILSSLNIDDLTEESDVNTIRELIRDYTTIRAFARLLRKSSIANGVHRALWSISQREKVRVSMIDWRVIRLVRVRRW